MGRDLVRYFLAHLTNKAVQLNNWFAVVSQTSVIFLN